MKNQRVRCSIPLFDWFIMGLCVVVIGFFGLILLRHDAWRDEEISQVHESTPGKTILGLANFASVHAKVACLFGGILLIWQACTVATVVLFPKSILIVRYLGLYLKLIRAKELESVVFLGSEEGWFAPNLNLLLRTKDGNLFNIGQSIKSYNLKTAKMISEMYGVPYKMASFPKLRN